MNESRGPQAPMTSMYAMADRVIPRLIDGAAQRWSRRIALSQEDQALSYAELREEVAGRGAALQDLGVGWQQPIAIMMGNHLDNVLTWLGATYQGRIQVNINTAYRGSLLTHVLNDSAAEVLVLESEFVPRILEIAPSLQSLRTLVVRGDMPTTDTPFDVRPFTDIASPGQGVREQDVEPWHVYGILYTSGTTGRSKGVVVSHVQPYSYCSPEYFRLADEDDSILVTLPQFHIAGQWAGVLSALYVGAKAALVESFSVSSFWDTVRAVGASQTTVVSTMADFLYRSPITPQDRDHPLRKILMSPIIREIREFEERFGVGVRPAYGQTELGSPVVGPVGGARPGGCGWVRPDFAHRIVDEHDQDVELGQAGELVLRPDEPWSIMLGYHNQPEATLAKWRNLWYHTGDTFREGADGELYFVDRSDDVIRRRGENVSSFEVEVELREHPAVVEVAVVGVDSEHYEQEIKAYVVLRPDAATTPRELFEFVRPRLPYFMVPRFIEVLEAFEKTPTQRIQKAPLRVRAASDATWDATAAGLSTRSE
jgi:crotonobetaine/carnitine-CoA ligase